MKCVCTADANRLKIAVWRAKCLINCWCRSRPSVGLKCRKSRDCLLCFVWRQCLRWTLELPCGCSSVIACDMISHISLPSADLPLLLPSGHRLCLLSVSSDCFTEAVKGPAVSEDLCLPSHSGPAGSENTPVPENASDFTFLVHFFNILKEKCRGKGSAFGC